MLNTHPKNNMTGTVILFCVAFILFSSGLLCSAEVIKIRVTEEMAPARLKPDPASEVIKQFPIGALLEATSKVGQWYEISFTTDDGYTVTAYIPSSSVQVISEVVAPPPPAYDATTPQEQYQAVDEVGALLNGFVLKFGVIDKGWNNWIGSLGYAFRLHRNISLGLEIMPSYTTLKDDTLELDLKTIHAFTLVNLRAGTSLHFIDPDMDFFKIYAGLGGGMGLSYSDSTIEGNSSTLFEYNPAAQILGGFELDTGKVSLLFEYQMLREFRKDVESSGWAGYIIFGIRL